METEEKLCRQAISLCRTGLSQREVGVVLGLSESKVRRCCKRISRNGRYVQSKKESATRRQRVHCTLSYTPNLMNGNSRRNVTVDKSCKVLQYKFAPQSHFGWCEFSSAKDMRGALRNNRSAFSKIKRKVLSERSIRRHRQVLQRTKLEPGRRKNKNWGAAVHHAQRL